MHFSSLQEPECGSDPSVSTLAVWRPKHHLPTHSTQQVVRGPNPRDWVGLQVRAPVPFWEVTQPLCCRSLCPGPRARHPHPQNPEANPRPTAQDLAGFWDLLQLSIEDISMKFDELYHLKANSWQLVETPEKRKVSMEQCGGEVQGQIPGRQ